MRTLRLGSGDASRRTSHRTFGLLEAPTSRDIRELLLPTDSPRMLTPHRKRIFISYGVTTRTYCYSQFFESAGRRNAIHDASCSFSTLLCRYSGQEDIVIGTVSAGRTQEDTEPLIGFFVNTLVLRTSLTGNPTFKELLQRVGR